MPTFPSTATFPSLETYPSGLDLSVVNVRERPDDSLALYVENPDGTERRIAGDELALPLTDYTLASTLPGGYSTLDGDAMLTRDEVPFGKFAAVSARLSDRTVVWEGRTESTPERSDEGTLRLSCMGHQAALKDAAGIVFLGVHSDLSEWEEPPAAYVESAAAEGSPANVNARFSMSASEGGISIRMEADQSVSAASRGEAWFRAPEDQRIAEIQYIASALQGTDMGPTVRVRELASAVDNDPLDTSDLSVKRWTPSATGQYAIFRDTPTASVNKTARYIRIHAASVFGDHDLPRVEIEDLPDGLYFSDILEYLIGLYAPILRTESGGESTIEQSSFPLPSAAWLEPTDLGTITEDGVQYEPGKDWAVWGRTFHYGTRASMGRTWTVRRSEGARFVDTGETAAPDYNGVVVTFTDGDGITRRVGPPGSGADTEDSSLRDDDPDNPVNASSVVGDRFLVVDVGDSKTAKALELGQLALEEALRRRFTGEIELPRYAEREGEILPTSLIRAGDKIVDGDSLSGDPLPLVGATYTRSSERPFQGTVDTPANRLDAAIARQGIRPKRINKKRIRNRLQRRRRRTRRQQRQGHK